MQQPASSSRLVLVGLLAVAMLAICARWSESQECETCPPRGAPASPWQYYREPNQGRLDPPEPGQIAIPIRRRVLVGLPNAQEQASGELRIEPNVRIAGHSFDPSRGNSSRAQDADLISAPLIGDSELLPPPQPNVGSFQEPLAEPVFGDVLAAEVGPVGCDCPPLGFLERWFGPQSIDGGIGRERVMLAPFEIDASSPQNQYRFRLDAVHGFPSPDRAELLFARPGVRGPVPEPSIDFQDLRALIETGTPTFSMGTEIPIRLLDREIGGNTAGLGDMNVTVKTVLLNGKEVQLTQILRTHLNTGAPSKGLGNGHVSLEPGILARYKWSDDLYFHGEVKYWFPLGGHPFHSGQVLNYGLGWSHVLYENDTFAILDTMEFVAWSVLDGQQFDFNLGQSVDIDGETAVRMLPGIRFVFDHGGDLGVSELGISGAMRTGGDEWYDGLLRIEARWVY